MELKAKLSRVINSDLQVQEAGLWKHLPRPGVDMGSTAVGVSRCLPSHPGGLRRWPRGAGRGRRAPGRGSRNPEVWWAHLRMPLGPAPAWGAGPAVGVPAQPTPRPPPPAVGPALHPLPPGSEPPSLHPCVWSSENLERRLPRGLPESRRELMTASEKAFPTTDSGPVSDSRG